jgi:hypothetical protein
MLDAFLDNSAGRFGVFEVSGFEPRFTTSLLDLLNTFSTARFGSRRNDDSGTFFGKELRDCRANSPASPRDQGNLAS